MVGGMTDASQEKKQLEEPQATEELAEDVQSWPRSVKSQRELLGFYAADYSKLVGVSLLTIYNREHGNP